jgi:hypothetical protein
MYSLIAGENLSWLRLYGVTDAGEIELRGARDLAPFDEARLVLALERLLDQPAAQQKMQSALRNLMDLHNRRAAGPKLRALRLYRVGWHLLPGMSGSELPIARVPIAEVAASRAE